MRLGVIIIIMEGTQAMTQQLESSSQPQLEEAEVQIPQSWCQLPSPIQGNKLTD